MPKQLRKTELTTTKDYAGGDTRQIPTTATVQVYKQGVIYVSGGPVNVAATNVTLTLRDTGRVIVGDTLVKESDIIAGTAGPPTVTVDTVTQGASVRVDHTSGGNMTLSAGDRLIVTSNAPTIYSESSGSSSTANPTSTDATTGYKSFYVGERFVDLKVSGSGLTTAVMRDVVGGESGQVVNGADYSTLQAALDDTPAGGTLYIPSGSWAINTHGDSGTLKLRSHHANGLNIVGDGINGTILTHNDDDKDIIDLTPAGGGNKRLEKFSIAGPGTVSSAPDTQGFGIKVGTVNYVSMYDLQIWSTGSHGISMGAASYVRLYNLYLALNGHDGIYMDGAYRPAIMHCIVFQPQRFCLHAVSSYNLNVVGGEYSHPHENQTGKVATDAAILLNSTHCGTFLGVDVEGFADVDAGRNSQTGVRVYNSRGFWWSNGAFFNDTLDAASIGIELDNADYAYVGYNDIDPTRTQTAVNVGSNCSMVTVYEQLTDCPVVFPTGANADDKGYIYMHSNGILFPQHNGDPSAGDLYNGMVHFDRGGARFRRRIAGAYGDL